MRLRLFLRDLWSWLMFWPKLLCMAWLLVGLYIFLDSIRRSDKAHRIAADYGQQRTVPFYESRHKRTKPTRQK